jgi:uncharacterized protein Yka (UPF0111/DUF47 family)
MKDKNIFISIIIGILLFLGFQQYMIWNNNSLSIDEQLIEKIDNLENKIDSLSLKKDSVRTIIVEIEKTINKNDKNYKEVVNTILNNDDSINYVWAKRYIEEYKLKHSK